MNLILLSARLLWRNWRAGEMKILAIALLMAVMVVTSISLFTDRLQHTLTRESHSFLAADKRVHSDQPAPLQWQTLAAQHDVHYAQVTTFSSMVFAGEAMQLAAIKAVTAGYPLRGQLTTSTIPFTMNAASIDVAEGVPQSGEAWVDSRLLPLVDIELGDQIEVGEKALTVTRVVITEPDRGNNFSVLGPRVLINAEDLSATGVIQPGSRINYRWLLAGETSNLQMLLSVLEPLLGVHDKVVGVEDSQDRLGNTLSTARQFLSFSAMISVLLAGVAIAIAARRFAARHIEQVALLKSLGSSAVQVRQLYGLQMFWLALCCSLLGLLLGYGFQALVEEVIRQWLPMQLMPATWPAFMPGLLTGIVCLLCFAAPPLWHLPSVSPMKILRRELIVSSVRQYTQVLIGLVALLLLVGLFSRDWLLTLSMSFGLFTLLFLGWMFARGLLKVTQSFGSRSGKGWRLALAGLQRNRQQTLIQTVVFALAITLLLSLTSLRTSLIEDWQLQLPPGTPNHFVMNIAPHQVEPVESLLNERQLELQQFFPIVRGRLTHINGELPTTDLRDSEETLRRELNLSWTSRLNKDNSVVAGQWWDQWQPENNEFGVSVEEQVAKRLGLSLGDDLQFSIGGLLLNAKVVSVRSLNWNSMNPNFYFLFSPNALDEFSPAYLTSFFIPPEQKTVVNDLLRFDPTMVVIEMDRIIQQIQTIVAQVSQGVELMLLLVLVSGFLVMWAAVTSSFHERQQEAALLRALGSSSKRLLGSLWLEFSLMGVMAGIMAVVASEILLLCVQTWVLDIPAKLHPEVWLWGISVSAVIIGVMGVLACRKIVTTPPAVVLRELA